MRQNYRRTNMAAWLRCCNSWNNCDEHSFVCCQNMYFLDYFHGPLSDCLLVKNFSLSSTGLSPIGSPSPVWELSLDRETNVSRSGGMTPDWDTAYLLLLLRSCTPQSAKTLCIHHEHTYVFYQFTDQKKKFTAEFSVCMRF